MTSMYNKIFTKILDSSIWMEPTPTRIVWLTLIAAMDEDGFVQFASVGNLAHRALVTRQEAQDAVDVLESPDRDSSDPDNEGRRIERVEGGWIVLNARKYRELVTREIIKEQTRARVTRFREKKRGVTEVKRGCNEEVTPSETGSVSDSEAKADSASKKDVEKKVSRPNVKSESSVEDWIKELSPDYPQVDVRSQFIKMRNWCSVNQKPPTKRRFVNWLNRVDVPLTLSTTNESSAEGWLDYAKK